MNLKLSSAISVFVCLVAAAFAQSTLRSLASQAPAAQAASAPQKPQVVYTTPPKASVAKFQPGGAEACEVRGKVYYRFTAANYDDTIVGMLIFVFSKESRKKIAEVSGKPLTSIPEYMLREDVVAGFRKGTSCPTVGIEIGEIELDVAGAKLSLKPIVVDVVETPQEVPQHICFWTRQINANRQRRGVIASLNRLITVEP